MTLDGSRPKCQAGGGPLERKVRRRSQLTCGPPATDGKDLTDEAVGSTAAEVSREQRILARGYKPSQRDFPGKTLLKARVGLNLGGKVCRVVDEVLRDGIDLHVV